MNAVGVRVWTPPSPVAGGRSGEPAHNTLKTGNYPTASHREDGCPVVDDIAAGDLAARRILLDAIRFCESAGSDVSRPNHAGALGPYQLLEPTWNDHAAGVPWSRAVDEPTARVVAARYLAWIERTLTKWQGRPATVEQVLSSWNGGIGRLRSVDFDVSRMPADSREFVRRVNKRMGVR